MNKPMWDIARMNFMPFRAKAFDSLGQRITRDHPANYFDYDAEVTWEISVGLKGKIENFCLKIGERSHV